VWTRQDAWLLQAIVRAGRRGELTSVIANADAINVDIPSRRQLEDSIGWLEAAELVVTEGTRVRAPQRLATRRARVAARVRRTSPDDEPLTEEADAGNHITSGAPNVAAMADPVPLPSLEESPRLAPVGALAGPWSSSRGRLLPGI